MVPGGQIQGVGARAARWSCMGGAGVDNASRSTQLSPFQPIPARRDGNHVEPGRAGAQITGPSGQMPGSAAPTWGLHSRQPWACPKQSAAPGEGKGGRARESEAVRRVGVAPGPMRQGQRVVCGAWCV